MGGGGDNDYDDYDDDDDDNDDNDGDEFVVGDKMHDRKCWH